MIRTLTREELAAHAVELPAWVKHGKRHGEPFAKREEGRARRKERRQVRARKSEWLNS